MMYGDADHGDSTTMPVCLEENFVRFWYFKAPRRVTGLGTKLFDDSPSCR